MSTHEIQEVKARIVEIDRQMIELQAERFNASLYLSVLLAHAAKANPVPVSSEAEQVVRRCVKDFEKEVSK